MYYFTARYILHNARMPGPGVTVIIVAPMEVLDSESDTTGGHQLASDSECVTVIELV